MRIVFIFLLSVLFCNLAVAEKGKTFGAPISLTEVSKVKDLIASYETMGDRPVLIEGQVDQVCKKMGCWLTLKTDAEPMRVVFKDYGFSVPKDIDGKKVRLQGKLVQKMMSVREQRHYLEDANASKEEIAKITEPKPTYRFIAAAVELK